MVAHIKKGHKNKALHANFAVDLALLELTTRRYWEEVTSGKFPDSATPVVLFSSAHE
jgi:hypothetical protein